MPGISSVFLTSLNYQYIFGQSQVGVSPRRGHMNIAWRFIGGKGIKNKKGVLSYAFLGLIIPTGVDWYS